MIFHITFFSRSKKLLFCYLHIINTYLQKNQNLTYNIQNQFFKKHLKKKITVLKSPHVNKKAKKTFAFCFYKMNINIFLNEKRKILFIYKLISFKFYIDCTIKVFMMNAFKNCSKHKNPKNFKLTTKNGIQKYMFLLDSYGESIFKKSLLMVK